MLIYYLFAVKYKVNSAYCHIVRQGRPEEKFLGDVKIKKNYISLL